MLVKVQGIVQAAGSFLCYLVLIHESAKNIFLMTQNEIGKNVHAIAKMLTFKYATKGITFFWYFLISSMPDSSLRMVLLSGTVGPL